MNRYTIGIDLGGSHAAIGLVGEAGHIESEIILQTPEYKNADSFVDAAFESITQLLKGEDITNILGIGIGAPNGNYFTGSIEHAPNLPWKGIVPLAQMLENKLEGKLPVYLTNDANAAAIGEMQFGIAKTENIRDFIMITLGTGLGSGVVVDGKLVYGHDGFAGELGHSSVFMEGGRLCGCGRKGCLERYASATGLVISAKEALENQKDSILLQHLDTLSALHVAEAALAGDRLALELFDETARILAFGLANATTVTSPKAFIFFGGLANAGDLLLSPLKKHFEEYVATIYRGKVQMLLSAIPENQAAVLGAAALVRQQFE